MSENQGVVQETCACGASFAAPALSYGGVHESLRDWRRAHSAGCPSGDATWGEWRREVEAAERARDARINERAERARAAAAAYRAKKRAAVS